MATYTITINERTQVGRSILQLMQELASVFTVKKVKEKTAFERSQEDIAAGRVYRADSVKDLMSAIYAD